eukprot:350352-Chlamydomonas_euryale.AAC.4
MTVATKADVAANERSRFLHRAAAAAKRDGGRALHRASTRERQLRRRSSALDSRGSALEGIRRSAPQLAVYSHGRTTSPAHHSLQVATVPVEL